MVVVALVVVIWNSSPIEKRNIVDANRISDCSISSSNVTTSTNDNTCQYNPKTPIRFQISSAVHSRTLKAVRFLKTNTTRGGRGNVVI